MTSGNYIRSEKQLENLKILSKTYGFKNGNQFGKMNKGKHPVNEFQVGHLVLEDTKRRQSERKLEFYKTLKGKEWKKNHSKEHKEWCATPDGKKASKKAYLNGIGKYPISGEGYFYNTPSEIEMKRCLKENGIHYRFQHFVWNIEHAYYADFYLPIYNTIIEVDGKVHNFKGNKDEIRTKELEEAGYRVLRFENGKFDTRSVWREI